METGTGKTISYLIAILNWLISHMNKQFGISAVPQI